jgi:hypothetical protein
MSLLESFLTEALLETVARQDVYVAQRDDGAVGAGTVDDPWDGSTAARFDEVMKNKVGANTTIHLGPGYFKTAGFNLTTGLGWKPKSGQRLVGSGMYLTLLQVENVPTGASVVAIGNKNDVDYLDGFEISDLRISCALEVQGANSSVGGIALTGGNIRVQRVLVKDYGSKNPSGSCAAISVARAHVNNPMPPFNCVIAECVVAGLASSHHPEAWATGLELAKNLTEMVLPYHEACVIRDCIVDPGDTSFQKNIRGIVIWGGLGTIVERNRIRNCKYGGPHQDETGLSVSGEWYRNSDIVVRENLYYNVLYGVYVKVFFWGIDRLIVERNWIELALNTSAVGVFVDRLGDGWPTIEELVVRRNRIQHNDGGSADNGPVGVRIVDLNYAVVDSNLIQVGNTSAPDLKTGVQYRLSNLSCFNNRTPSGQLLRAYHTDVWTPLREFTTQVEETADLAL